ncbi:aquaporin [Plantactinospora sp. ZYX-F-223]|uniref:MIP/aquaporin family protein n=1 Tax=Plantactinospora sp. ZYX-F-223 TaxID=3144103 RepID=UPI0031FE3BAC
MDNGKRYGAELLGTFLLVFFGAGTAVAALDTGGVVVVALAFGLVLLALVYVFGPVSGCHVNPAVTLGALLTGRISLPGAIGYWIAQVLGGIAAGFLIFALSHWGDVPDQTGHLGANEYGATINLGGALVLEIVLTFFFVLVVLVVTSRTEQVGVTGLAIGLALGTCHLVAVTLDGTSVNPARSIGPALFNGGAPLSQLWVFIVAPLIGGALAAAASPLALRAARTGPRRPQAGADTP